MKFNTLDVSDWVKDHAKKRKREYRLKDTNDADEELDEHNLLQPLAKRRS